jgi:hypothetical protein
MIMKLRNHPYAPKVGANSQMGAKRKGKKGITLTNFIIRRKQT